MEKILLDTDIGSDIDDAVCLAYLLMQPECELMGITTVLGETDDRCRLASALCYAAGKDIPLYPGARRAILDHTPPSEVSQLKGLGGCRTARIFRRGMARLHAGYHSAAIPAKSHCCDRPDDQCGPSVCLRSRTAGSA